MLCNKDFNFHIVSCYDSIQSRSSPRITSVHIASLDLCLCITLYTQDTMMLCVAMTDLLFFAIMGVHVGFVWFGTLSFLACNCSVFNQLINARHARVQTVFKSGCRILTAGSGTECCLPNSNLIKALLGCGVDSLCPERGRQTQGALDGKRDRC